MHKHPSGNAPTTSSVPGSPMAEAAGSCFFPSSPSGYAPTTSSVPGSPMAEAAGSCFFLQVLVVMLLQPVLFLVVLWLKLLEVVFFLLVPVVMLLQPVLFLVVLWLKLLEVVFFLLLPVALLAPTVLMCLKALLDTFTLSDQSSATKEIHWIIPHLNYSWERK